MGINKTKILVIGGAGYIGSHIVKELCDKKYDVTIFDNLNTGLVENIDKRAKFVKGDILDKSCLDKVFSKGFDCIIHFAALKAAGESMKTPEIYSENNIIGTINILNVMSKHKIRNIVFSSSAAVYGTPKYLPMDEKHPTNPENFYGFTKLEIERIFEWYSKLGKINYAALRYFNAAGYGSIKGKERNPANLLPIVMETAVGKRKVIQIYGNDYNTKDGTCIRDYIHVLDLASAHLLAMEYIQNNKKDITVNLGSEKGYSVLEVIQAAEKIIKKKINYEYKGRRAGDPDKIIASSKLASKLLGWKAKDSDIKNILESMWLVYKDN